MNDSRDIWNSRYSSKRKTNAEPHPYDPWLDRWLHLAPSEHDARALDIGCGDGQHAAFLTDKGFQVTAIDISEEALELCREICPAAQLLPVDIRNGLPFADKTFSLIVADLSLHYFDWSTTVKIVNRIADCLKPSGLFLGRFNAVGDINFGSASGEPVDGDPRLLMVNGLQKRFFTEDCLSRLFVLPWRIVQAEETTTGKYGRRKVCWELIATAGA